MIQLFTSDTISVVSTYRNMHPIYFDLMMMINVSVTKLSPQYEWKIRDTASSQDIFITDTESKLIKLLPIECQKDSHLNNNKTFYYRIC